MNKLCLVALAISLQASDIRISEVMSNPQGSEYENEFIEIYNHSDHVIQVNGWVISDGTGIDTLVHLSGPADVRPQAYAVILDPSYPITTGPYLGLIPDSIPIYTLSTDATFGSGGLSNSGESVIIYNPDSTIWSQMSWTTSSENGYSWERVSIDVADSLAVWQESLIENGTPGFRNSVAKPAFNLALSRVEITRSVPNESVNIVLTISNTGEESVNSFSIYLYEDENQNGILDDSEWDDSLEVRESIEPQSEWEISRDLFDLTPGIHKVTVQVESQFDEVSSDDTLHFEVIGSYRQGVVSITEIMASPSDEQGGEWVEIMNISGEPVSLQGWSISDANQTRHLITDSLKFLAPDSMIILCAHPQALSFFTLQSEIAWVLDSWPTLNSTSDSVRLYDATNQIVSRAYYKGSWGSSAKSLERRHPRLFPLEDWNWASSVHVDGATPAAINTQLLDDEAIQVEQIALNVYNPIGPTPVRVNLYFNNIGLDTLRELLIESQGLHQWLGQLPSFQPGFISFLSQELNSGASTVPIRIYSGGHLLADTSFTVTLGFSPGRLALNEIHYLPHEDQVEFLEFVNIGDDTLNLNNWVFEDRSGTTGKLSSSMLIPPDSLFLLCADSLVLTDWAPVGARIIEVSPWPSLNNSSDSILIFDPVGIQQLAHAYEDDQGGEYGKSMERLALWKTSQDWWNWATCEDPLGITPGRQNSIQNPPANLVLSNLRVMGSDSLAGESIQLEVEVVNAGLLPETNIDMTIKVIQDDWSIIVDLSLPLILSQDTLWQMVELELDRCGWLTFVAEVLSANDDLSEDNKMTLRSYVTCQESPLIINEIMPVPYAGQAEWVEIFNRSDRAIDILGWQISDNSLNSKTWIDSSLKLDAGEYLLLSDELEVNGCAWDCLTIPVPGFPTLNNSADRVVLFDPQGFEMDAVSYDEFSALVEGRSRERIRVEVSGSDPRNWGLCIDESASTPGYANSLHLTELSQKLRLTFDPNPFTPNGDGHQDELIIRYELAVEQALMSVIIYDMAGRKIAEPIQIKAIAHRGQVSWDGMTSYGGIAATGLYICKLLIDDLQGNVSETLRKVYLVK